MMEPSLVLLVSENPAHVQMVREALERGGEPLTVQHVERARTAAARIAGGGVGSVLFDISGKASEQQKREAFQVLRNAASGLPLMVLCEAEEENLAARMAEDGAAAYLLRSDWQRDLRKRVLGRAAGSQVRFAHAQERSQKRGNIIAVVGAKGGVGSTTVAVNVASVLASTAKAVLAELRPPFGTLCHFFRPHRATRTLQALLPASPDEVEWEQPDVASCLWPNRNIPGLSVLFAPDKASSQLEIGSGTAREILRRVAELSDVVVVDLPASFSDADQAILAESDTLALVVERDALSVDAAKAKLSALEAVGIVPPEAGTVIVNRVPLAAPLALADIEAQLGLPTFGVIPPAADLCAAAYRVHIPVVKLDAQSLIATSFTNLANRFTVRR